MKKVAIGADRITVDVYDRMKRKLGVSDESVQKVLARVDKLRRRKG